MGLNVPTKLQLENPWKLRTAIINRSYENACYYLLQNRAPFFAFFYKTRVDTQQMLPVQTGLYRYDE